MKTFRQPFLPMRALLAGLLMLGWMIAGNHCALGLMPKEGKAETCPGCQTQPAQKAPVSGGMQECCQSIPSLPVEMAKAHVTFDPWVLAVLDVAAELIVAEPEGTPLQFDGGPPRVLSFSELVLQRSLHSHAPPFQA